MAIDPSLLPPVMRTLVQLIGLENTVKLLKERGGCRVYIAVTPSDWFVATIGASAARKLCDRFGGQEIDFPKYDKIVQKVRNEGIVADRDTMSLNQLATKYGLTRRHILNILNAHSPRTEDLFS